MTTITEKTIAFFKEELGVDVSNVMMLFTELDERQVGVYNEESPGMIFIDRQKLEKMSKINTYMTIVHELTHLVQFEYSKSISIPFKEKEMAIDYDNACSGLNWCERPLEIDAILTELYYLLYIGADKEKVIKIGKWRFKNNKTKNIELCINELKTKPEFIDIANIILDELFPTKEFNKVI